MTQLQFLRQLKTALDGYQPRALFTRAYNRHGERCALGTLLPKFENGLTAACYLVKIAEAHREIHDQIVWENDNFDGTPEERYVHMAKFIGDLLAQAQEHEGRAVAIDLPVTQREAAHV